MTTSYYWRYNHCAACGRYDQAHVGSTMRAWQGYKVESPFGFPIVSLADWRRVFTTTVGELWDEYDRKVEGDPDVWLDGATPRPDHELYGDDWIDPQGFYFTGREFC